MLNDIINPYSSPVQQAFQDNTASANNSAEEVATGITMPDESFPQPDQQESDDFIVVPTLNYDGYQVVRQEFFAHIREPSLTFNNNRVYVNAYCLMKLPQVTYVQYLVNSDNKTVIIRPCSEYDKDAVAWCSIRDGKHIVKQVTGKVFTAMIMSMMKWNLLYRYKLLGKIVKSSTETVLLFDLKIPEIYEKTFLAGDKVKTARTPVLPPDVLQQFGLSFAEHQQLKQISIFDGYTVFGVQDIMSQDKQEQSEGDDRNESSINHSDSSYRPT